MKPFATIIGILLIVGGGLFIYNGVQSRQTVSYKFRKELSSAMKSLYKDPNKANSDFKDNSNVKIYGGGFAVLSGIILIYAGSKKMRIQ